MVVPPDEGGEAVCWIDQVCAECGRLVGDDAPACPSCGARLAAEHDEERDEEMMWRPDPSC